MRLIHLADLHLGKRVNGFPMIGDQKHILEEILRIIGDERPDAVLIAGDIYDRPVPPAEAVALFDDFLVRLSRGGPRVFIISGNHDSPERMAFGGRLMDASGIHFSPVYDGRVTPFRLEDGFGTVNVFMLPFIRPANARVFFPEEEITDCNGAVRAAVNAMEPDPADRNVLMTHQFVTGAERSDSEDVPVGGSDGVDASVFGGFDYVALGHLHRPQNVGSERIRYAGSPLKYSFSEAGHQKSVTVAEMGPKGSLSVRTVPLKPLHDMRELRGTYAGLMLRSFYEKTSWPDDYTHITLTDEEDVPDAVGRLRVIYHNLMRLDYDNARTRSGAGPAPDAAVGRKSPFELFAGFYELQNGRPMSDRQSEFMRTAIGKTWEAAE